LFVIVINDLPQYVNNKAILYADDTTLVTSGHEILEAQASLNTLINRANKWFEANNLKINKEKSENITFSLRFPKIEFSSVRLLGIYVDNRLSWETHTTNLMKKLSRVIFLLRKLKLSVSKDMLLQSYFAFFHPHLLYGIRLWGNSAMAHQVFIYQKKAVRVIVGAKPRDSCVEHFQNLKIMTLPCMYIYSNLVNVFENLDKFNLRNDVHSHNTRFQKQIDLPSFRLSKSKDSHLYMQIKLFNKLPESAKYISLNKFKSILKEWLLTQTFYRVTDFIEHQEIDIKF
jgi:hypothetical protein